MEDIGVVESAESATVQGDDLPTSTEETPIKRQRAMHRDDLLASTDEEDEEACDEETELFPCSWISSFLMSASCSQDSETAIGTCEQLLLHKKTAI